MGLSVGGVCYATQALANDAYFTGQPIQIAPQDSMHVVIVSYQKQGAIWSQVVDSYNIIDGYSEGTNTIPQANRGSPCTDVNDPATIMGESLTYVSAIIALWVAVAAIRWVYDFFKVPHAD